MSQGRALVTGGAGFIGSHTAEELLRTGYDVRVMDSLVPPVHAEGADWPDWLPKGVERFLGDVRSREDWRRALRGVDVVFHLAAYQDLLPNFSQFFHVNSDLTLLEKNMAQTRIGNAISWVGSYCLSVFHCSFGHFSLTF